MPRIAAALAAVLLAAPAAAAEIAADPVLTAVTVYPDRARVTRAAVVSLPEGESTVVFAGLPAATVAESVRVEGRADVPLAIASVESARAFLTDLPGERERELTERLQAARDERRVVDDRIQALNDKLAFIRSVAEAAPPAVKEGLLQGDPDRWAGAWERVGEGAAGTYAAIHEEQVARRAVQARVEKLEQELARVRTGRRRVLDVRVHVTAGAPGEARLSLDAQVPDASWRPVYDARLDPEAGHVTLVHAAEVRQRTGEDWDAVTLTLSTARPGAGARMPEPEPWFLGFGGVTRDEIREGRVRGILPKARGFVGAPSREEAARLDLPAEPLLSEAAVSAFAAAFRVPGVQAVPADDEPHRFTVARHEADADLRVRAHPKADTAAYLYAAFEHPGAAPLLAGPVNLFRGGALVGRARLPQVRPGEEVRLPFGVDDRVRVTHRLDTDLSGDRGLFKRRHRAERRYRIGVRSFHRMPVEITVYDRLPVPKDEAIQVAPLEDWATPPTATDAEDKPGVLAWTGTYAPGEQREIRFGYTVTWPEDRDLPGF